jgi:HPt (histidine-containing phosphotransfer) domain-containing protein
MKEELSDQKFNFDPIFDSNFLYEMYENDYQYVEEIFRTTSEGFQPDFEAIKTAFAQQDLESLKKAVHKMKPAMGFVGLLSLQQQCQNFEQECAAKQEFKEIIINYHTLLEGLTTAKEKIIVEITRLHSFNNL